MTRTQKRLRLLDVQNCTFSQSIGSVFDKETLPPAGDSTTRLIASSRHEAVAVVNNLLPRYHGIITDCPSRKALLITPHAFG
ncbi:hypothetical protein MHYP_G00324860 [Metynnis hypsauchen]